MSSTAYSSTAMKGREPPLKKKKNPSTEPTTITSLPYDLLVSCLARVSRLYYPTLSLVSKSFRSFIDSPELYQTRNLLGRTENCLYVCLRFPLNPNPRWFTLSQRPDQTLTNHTNKKKSSDNVLASIRILNSPTMEWSNLVAVGPYIYAINGPLEDTPYSTVSFLDCRTHTWLEAPRMLLAHTDSGIDGSMYLPGSCENYESLNCIEVLNKNTQTWKPVPHGKRIFNGRNMEGKIYMNLDRISGKKGLAFNPKEMTGELIGFELDLYSDIGRVCFCRVEDITYRFNSGEGFGYRWFVNGDASWRKIDGLEGLPKFAGYSNVRLVDYGGKLVVFWDKYVRARGGYKDKMIWCAVISLEKRNNCEEIWGKVEWFDAVLTVPKSYEFVCAIVATV